jgi:hypothetical protein
MKQQLKLLTAMFGAPTITNYFHKIKLNVILSPSWSIKWHIPKKIHIAILHAFLYAVSIFQGNFVIGTVLKIRSSFRKITDCTSLNANKLLQNEEHVLTCFQDTRYFHANWLAYMGRKKIIENLYVTAQGGRWNQPIRQRMYTHVVYPNQDNKFCEEKCNYSFKRTCNNSLLTGFSTLAGYIITGLFQDKIKFKLFYIILHKTFSISNSIHL